MSSTGDILAAESVAQDLDDSLRTNETGLLHLEDQIDRLTDAIISASTGYMALNLQSILNMKERATAHNAFVNKKESLNIN